MEIDLNNFYRNRPMEVTDTRKKAILKSLEEERQARRACIAEGRRFKLESFDTLSSPMSLNDETRPLRRESPTRKSDLVKFQSISSDNKSPDRADFMHNQLKDPDFEQLSMIYENYLKSPKIIPTKVTKVPSKPLTSPSRCSSAPNSCKKNRQDLINQREEEFKRNCTFKPKINRSGYSKQLNYSESPGNLTFEQKIEQLARPRSELIEKREKMRRDREMGEDNECTFKPCITPYKSVNRSFSEYPVEERLYQDAETKFNERERIKREKEDQLANKFPYSPQVQASVSKLVGIKRDKPPLYQRLEEVQKEMSERKKIIRLEAENNDPDLTFRPQINQNSNLLAQMKKNRELNSSRGSSVERKRIVEQSIEENYTFTPQISYNPSVSAKDFLERQKALQQKLQMKREQMMERLQSSYTFKPNIDRTSQYMTEGNKERAKNKLEERLNSDGRRKQELQENLAKVHYSQFTYEPSINPLSKKLGRSSSLSEIAFSTSAKEAKKRVAEEKAAEIEKKCSFTPTINGNEKFRNIESRYKQNENISQVINEDMTLKRLKQEGIKKSNEYESMKECTFAPKGVGRVINSEANVKVKGMERFLELKEIARKREEELREREEKVFLVNPQSNPDGYTVPKPFNLHPSNKLGKVERVKQEMLRKEQSECLFKPQTNEQ